MQSIDQLFDRLKTYVTTVSWVFSLLETLIALLFGGLIGAQLSDKDYTRALWVTGVVYLLLLIAKLSTQPLFPSAVVEELRSRKALDETKKQLARRDIISGFITQSITALNLQTCAISSEAEKNLCSQAVSTGLSQVIEPLINRPQYLFDCNESKFTVAALVSYRESPPSTVWKQDFIVFRDDNGIRNMLTWKLQWDYGAKGSLLDVQKVVQRCYNDNIFVCDGFTHDGVSLTMVASPIPEVCETTALNGVLVFATRCGHPCPPDVETTLRIFGRIVANWLAKYSECVVAKESNNSGEPNPSDALPT